MKTLIFSMLISLIGYSALAQHTSDLLNKYIIVKNALVNSDGEEAVTAINTFYQAIKKEEPILPKYTLLKATEKLLKAENIEKQRAVFNEVSIEMWNLVKNSDEVNQSVYYQYCPMKDAYWLSYDKDIKNPYYGASMLTCGKTTATKN